MERVLWKISPEGAVVSEVQLGKEPSQEEHWHIPESKAEKQNVKFTMCVVGVGFLLSCEYNEHRIYPDLGHHYTWHTVGTQELVTR